MITRRHFIVSTAATASTQAAATSQARQQTSAPLKALPRRRTLTVKQAEDGRLLLVSDGPGSPQKLVKPEALERLFGPGTDLVLQQPDHWRMIEEGWFADKDLYVPTDHRDPAFYIWHANYRPETEAHDLLYDLFQDRITGPFGARFPDLGLELAEHPSTPRFATAKVDDEWCLSNVAAKVAERTSWLVVSNSWVSSKVGR